MFIGRRFDADTSKKHAVGYGMTFSVARGHARINIDICMPRPLVMYAYHGKGRHGTRSRAERETANYERGREGGWEGGRDGEGEG